MRPLPHGRQIEIPGKAAVVHLHIPRLQVFQLLEGQSHFAQSAGFQARLQTDPVQQIIHDGQPRFGKTGAGGPVLVGGGLPAKGLAQLRAVGQPHRGTVQPQESVFAPALEGLLRAIDRRQDAIAIQLEEGAVFELGPRMRHRSAGHRLKDCARGQLVQEFVPVALDRLDGLWQHKKHQQGKGQLALAREILRPHAVAGQEVFITQPGAQSFDECDEMMGKVINN